MLAESTVVRAASAAEVADRRDELVAALTAHGFVLVRGLGAADVTAAAAALVGPLVVEREGFAPRGAVAGGVYTSSAWPHDEPMCCHHELSYTTAPPSLIAFGCVAGAASGGEIGLADARVVLDRLPPELVRRFASDGWQVLRSYNGEVGVTLAEAFGTEDRAGIEEYCAAHGIEAVWTGDGALRTRARRAAVVDHPVTGERCWFNQIAFLNEWTMSADVREYLVALYGAEGLPFTTAHGDGSAVAEEEVSAINAVYEAATVRVALEAGDVLLVDNVRTAHSRAPYTGAREVVVAMGTPIPL